MHFFALLLPLLIFGITMLCGFFSHILWSISTIFGPEEMFLNEAVLAILGVVFPPIGAIHGISLWF